MQSHASPQPASELDRHHLHNVRRAFLQLNQARLTLARDSLLPSQRLFLDVLPALFHFNHPMLPGYLYRNTPSGLDGYHPSDEEVQQLRKLARSFHPNRYRNQRSDIQSIFSMGSLGTIAQNNKSDIDIWLCYRPNLNRKALTELETKCKKVSDWAKTLQLDVTIFLMNTQTMHTKSMAFNRESSGSTQHYLLMDEFFRTAIHLGGQLPAWLFIHPQQEADYQNHLSNLHQQRLLPEAQFLDLGVINSVPASEFISSAIWQLYKAIDSPYKSILKLLVLEIYCQNYENLTLLSSTFKQLLHSLDRHVTPNIWDADPYLQAYYFIEKYLQETHQQERLEFLRRCFYFKLEQPLSGKESISRKSNVLLELTKGWGWDTQHIKHLDEHNKWNLDEVLEERRLIVSELNHSYHLIMEFFRTQKSQMHASNRELNVLGRKLHAAFSRKAGKIDWVNPLHSKSIIEPVLIIKKQIEPDAWVASDKTGKIIASKATPVELLTWLHCNQVMIPASRLYFKQFSLDSRQLQSLRRYITSLLPLPIKTANHEVFEEGSYLKELLIFADYRPDEIEKVNTDEDALNALNIESTIDYLSFNSWNEIICHTRRGPLLETVISIFVEAIQQDPASPKPDILCNHPNRHIQQRLREYTSPIFTGLIEFFQKNPSGRYIARIFDHYLVVHIHQQKSTIRWLTSEKELKRLLSKSMPYPSQVAMDNHTMGSHPLKVFSDLQQKDSIQTFFSPRGYIADITLIDESGAWYQTIIDNRYGTLALQSFHHFLRAINDRRHEQSRENIGPMDILPIDFYKMISQDDNWSTQRLSISSQKNTIDTLSIFAVAEYEKGKLIFELHHEEKVFSEKVDGEFAYINLLNYASENDKPVYITDLDLTRCRLQLSPKGQLQTAHYLKVKTILEEKLRAYEKNLSL
jgi:adenylate cyclase class 1